MKSEVPGLQDLHAVMPNPKKLAFALEARDHRGAIVLHCQGRLVFHHEARALARTVTEILPSARTMVVDLVGIEAVDSAGLGQLVLLHMWANAGGYTLKFAGAGKSVRQVLELANLVEVLDLYPSVPEAIAAMQPQEAPTP